MTKEQKLREVREEKAANVRYVMPAQGMHVHPSSSVGGDESMPKKRGPRDPRSRTLQVQLTEEEVGMVTGLLDHYGRVYGPMTRSTLARLVLRTVYSQVIADAHGQED